MDFNFKISLESKQINVCRFCLKEDGSQEITTCFPHSDAKTTYEEVLKSTFNIQISYKSTDAKCMICERCITSLRDASMFKQMVLQSHDTLSEYLRGLQYDDEADKLFDQNLEDTIKIETDVFADDSPDDDEILANIKHDLRNDAEQITKIRRRCKLDKKETFKRSKIEENKRTVSNISTEKDWNKIAERRGTGPLLRDNSLKLIQNSTLCVFQWNKSRYRCFCCNQPFPNINLLKEHTITEHTLENIEKKIILQQNRLVKVEISNLECKLCREKVEDISLLTQHLSSCHGMGITEHLLVPFKIEDELKCQICFERFSVFRLLNIHINRHFQKQVCHLCGAGFSNLVFLNLHKTRVHRPFECKACDLTFKNKTDKKHHDMTTHGATFVRKLRFPCPFCPARFFQENFKVRHLVDEHGLPKPDFKCNVCSKSFLTRSLCNNHVKNVHNKERNQECDVCHNFFYTKSDVARHRVTHTGEKKFSCEMCNNLFASRDSLRRHMKRTHGGVH